MKAKKFTDKPPIRFVIAGMICGASILGFIVQGSMSVAIVAMTQSNSNTQPPDVNQLYTNKL